MRKSLIHLNQYHLMMQRNISSSQSSRICTLWHSYVNGNTINRQWNKYTRKNRFFTVSMSGQCPFPGHFLYRSEISVSSQPLLDLWTINSSVTFLYRLDTETENRVSVWFVYTKNTEANDWNSWRKMPPRILTSLSLTTQHYFPIDSPLLTHSLTNSVSLSFTH